MCMTISATENGMWKGTLLVTTSGWPGRERRKGRTVTYKVPFQVPFSVAEIVIHMQGLHQTAAPSQNKELASMTTTSQNHSGIGVCSAGEFLRFCHIELF